MPNYPNYYQPGNFYQPNYYASVQQTAPVPANPQPVPQPVSQNQNGIIWVQGEAGAKSYLVAPNNTVTLWDSEDEVIYLKSADANGMPSMKILDYKMREGNVSKSDNNSNFVTRETFEREIKQLRRKIDGMSNLNKEDSDDDTE